VNMTPDQQLEVWFRNFPQKSGLINSDLLVKNQTRGVVAHLYVIQT